MGQVMKLLFGPTRSWRQIREVATLLLLVWSLSACGGGVAGFFLEMQAPGFPVWAEGLWDSISSGGIAHQAGQSDFEEFSDESLRVPWDVAAG